MLTIQTEGAPILYKRAKEVKTGSDITALIMDMWKVLYQAKALGLAANQVGELKRVIVIQVPNLTQEFINPIIKRRWGGKIVNIEGCLSFPGQEVKIARYKRITIEGYDRNWNKISLKLSGIAAVCAQHEVDHLNGITIL